MEWVDCKQKTNVNALIMNHLEDDHNSRVVLLYKDGSTTVLESTHNPSMAEEGYVKYLLTYEHPNAEMIKQWADAVRPVYFKGDRVSLCNALDYMQHVDPVNLSFEPRTKKEIVSYRRYLYKTESGRVAIGMSNESHSSFNEEHLFGFIKWLDSDWQKEEVEL